MTRMRVTDRALGLLRSVVVYHGIPLRQRRLRRLYAHFAAPGELVFDLGAHVGNRTRALAAIGCRVVALEPQPDCVRVLRTLFGRSTAVEIVQAAVGSRTGTGSIAVSDRTPTMTTLTTEWRDARAGDPTFAGVDWNRRLDVEIVTLDALIARFGQPVFIKIDVEGGEPDVLAGLNQPVRALSFEYLPAALDYTRRCVLRLGELAAYRYNWSPGETAELMVKEWLTGEALVAALESPRARRRSGDVYARLATGV